MAGFMGLRDQVGSEKGLVFPNWLFGQSGQLTGWLGQFDGQYEGREVGGDGGRRT
jgi:hypothetical protein